MATRPDYYRILQVHPGAEKEVIDAAYRRLAAKYHPDVNQAFDASDRMKQLNTAYEVLSDPAKRAAYDASLGVATSSDTPPYAAARPRRLTKPWQALLIVAGVILIAVVAFRLGPAFLLAAPRLVVTLVVILFVVWLLLTLVKQRR